MTSGSRENGMETDLPDLAKADQSFYFSAQQKNCCETMSTGKETNTWRQTGVLIRLDIFDEAERQHVDISGECNAALARRLGITFEAPVHSGTGELVPHEDGMTPAPAGTSILPVINADDPASPAKVLKEKKEAVRKPRTTHRPAHPPVHQPSTPPAGSGTPVPALPAAPGIPHTPVIPSVLQETSAPGTPSCSRGSPDARDASPPVVPTTAAPVTPQKRASRKLPTGGKKMTGAIKKFVSTRIVRSGDGGGTDTVIPKDELYLRFVNWCGEQEIHTVPDRRAFTVALKTQYAIQERTIGGMPYWVNVRVR